MSSELQGKVAIVTGAATGIGKAIAFAFGTAGARVVVNHLGTPDARGLARVYAMTFSDGRWTLLRDAPDFTPLAFPQRFTGEFSADGRTISGRWERSGDGTSWQHDFDLVYTKVG
jgi:NAD(P)-dependent dehydrogenase (short-subunit alcohol dehydrogenase family)